MDTTDDNFDIVEDIPEMPNHQLVFDELLQQYNSGMEPLDSWLTQDLVKLLDAIDRELQSRNIDASDLIEKEDYVAWSEYEGNPHYDDETEQL